MQPDKKDGLPSNFNEQVSKITSMAMTILHNPSTKIEEDQLPSAYQSATQSSENPEDAGPLAIADVTLWVFAQVEQQIRSKGKMVQPVILLGALGAITSQVSEVAEAAGLFQVSEEDMQIAVATAINKYVIKAKKQGRISDQELAQAAKALQSKYPDALGQFSKTVETRQQRQKAPPNTMLSPKPPNGILRG